MLTVAESTGLKTILGDINDCDLFSILDTVTKRMFATKVRNEAIEIILTCTSNPVELLKRQKVNKKVIFNYLLKVGVPVISDLSKKKLVDACLKFWDSSDSCEENDLEEMETQQNQVLEVTSNENQVLMRVEFSKWFFQMLNTQNEFGPQHFWPSCKLLAQLHTPSEMKEVSLSGANNVVTFFSNLIIFDKFYFDANTSGDSIGMEEDPHGLFKIIVKGVLHQHSNCVGLFDLAIGLIKTPLYENTYKIQLVNLKMQTNTSTLGILPGNRYLSLS